MARKCLFSMATPVSLTATPSNVVIASNIATLTFGGAHGLSVGEVVGAKGVHANVDGQRVIASVPNATTLTFAVPTATLASTAASGAVRRLTGMGGKTTSSFVAVNGAATVTMTAPHGFALDDLVYVSVGDVSVDGLRQVIAVPSNVSVVVDLGSTYAVGSTSRAGAVGLMLPATPPVGLAPVATVPAGKEWLMSGAWVLPPDGQIGVPYAVWMTTDEIPGDKDRAVSLVRKANEPELFATGATLAAGTKVYAIIGGARATLVAWGEETTA